MKRMRKLGLVAAILALAACGGGASGSIGRACMAGGRQAASPALCSCVQRVAGQSLSSADQRRAAGFFTNPQAAQDARASNRPGDDAFWSRYDAFADRAEALCR